MTHRKTTHGLRTQTGDHQYLQGNLWTEGSGPARLRQFVVFFILRLTKDRHDRSMSYLSHERQMRRARNSTAVRRRFLPSLLAGCALALALLILGG